MGDHAGSYRMLRGADLAENLAVGRLAFALQHLAAAAGRIAVSFNLRQLEFARFAQYGA